MRLEPRSIVETVKRDMPCELVTDWTRYNAGSLAIGVNIASFKHNGESGSISASGVDIAVHLGKKTWCVNLSEIVAAVIDADEQYEKTTTVPKR